MDPKFLVIFCALRGVFPNILVLFTYDQTFWSSQIFPQKNFWAGYAIGYQWRFWWRWGCRHDAQ